MEWVRWGAWTCVAVAVSVLLEYVSGGFGAATAYSLTGSTREHSYYLGTIVADVTNAIVLCLSIFMYDGSGRRAFWIGIVITQFVRYIPAAAMLVRFGTSTSVEVVTLLYSAHLWWSLRAIIAVAALGWLCMKRTRPSWGNMALSGITSIVLLEMLLQWGPGPLVGPSFLWRFQIPWGLLEQ